MCESDSESHWFVLRDLKRYNATLPAYEQLAREGFDVFTPMKTVISVVSGKRVRKTVPYIRDLLFVFSTREQLDPTIENTKTLQYRYVKGAPKCTPMVVNTVEMARFITAVTTMGDVRYLSPSEITPANYHKRIRVHCDGPLDGMEGILLTVKGSSKKRLLVELSGILMAAVEISPDYIELI